MPATRNRKIHVDLPVEVHRKLRVKAAVEDVSMQAFVAQLVSRSVANVSLPERSDATGPTTGQDLLDSGLVGIWKKRRDIGDSLEFARKLRSRAEARHRR